MAILQILRPRSPSYDKRFLSYDGFGGIFDPPKQIWGLLAPIRGNPQTIFAVLNYLQGFRTTIFLILKKFTPPYLARHLTRLSLPLSG